MSQWNGTIIGPGHVRFIFDNHWTWSYQSYVQTIHENRIYSLKIVCGESYPDQPPLVQFISRVNLPFVNQHDGKVDPGKIAVLGHWSRNSSLETILVEIRRYAP
jgi:ubiquitin-conjugating enzyme E2 variant